MLDKNLAAVWIALIVCVSLTVTVTTLVVLSNSTERIAACVESGGDYIQVPNTSTMECVQD